MFKVTINPQDLQRIIFDRLAPAIEGEAFENQVMSLIVLSVMLQRPNISIEHLQSVVLQLTEYLMMILDEPAEVGLAN